MTICEFDIVPVTHYQQNCSIVWCAETRRAALIDPGGDVERLKQVIQQKSAQLGLQIERILLTHGHLDHVGGAQAMREHLQVPIVGPHRDDAFWLDALPQQAEMMGFDPRPALQPDKWLDSGAQVDLGELRFDVKHCPGHTPGHIVFFEPQARLAWVGDVLFAGSIGRTDFPRGNHAQLITSIRKTLFPLGDDVRFVPGHGPMSDFGTERAQNPFVADTRFG